MTDQELHAGLDPDPDWDWLPAAALPDCPDPEGTVIISYRFQSAILVSPESLERLTLPQLKAAAIQGLDVAHITRVTGYFSRTESWNPGKVAELRDRKRGLT